MPLKKQEYLYGMQCKDYIKFGVSNNPIDRRNALQTGNPFQITLLFCVPYNDSYGTEKDVHRYFKDIRGKGEWFKIDENIKNFVKYLKNIEYEVSKR
jgi:hypothetical protein